jgi:hypothetical protein
MMAEIEKELELGGLSWAPEGVVEFYRTARAVSVRNIAR